MSAGQKLRLVALVVLVQATLMGGYLWSRNEKPARSLTSTMIAPTPLPAGPGLEALDGLRGPLLLHFWATWCAPCRDELPALLALDGQGVRVVAVSVDERQDLIDAFFKGVAPPAVRRVDHAVVGSSVLDVDTVPVTFVVDAAGRAVARVDGAQDWTREAALSLLEGAP